MSKVYIFDVVLQWSSKVIRRIAIRGDQTLHDLHETIVDAFERDDDHLYSFYVGVGTSRTRRRLESAAEYVSPFSESDAYDADEAKLKISTWFAPQRSSTFMITETSGGTRSSW